MWNLHPRSSLAWLLSQRVVQHGAALATLALLDRGSAAAWSLLAGAGATNR